MTDEVITGLLVDRSRSALVVTLSYPDDWAWHRACDAVLLAGGRRHPFPATTPPPGGTGVASVLDGVLVLFFGGSYLAAYTTLQASEAAGLRHAWIYVTDDTATDTENATEAKWMAVTLPLRTLERSRT